MITVEGILIPWFAVFILVLAFIAFSLWLWNRGWDSRDKQ